MAILLRGRDDRMSILQIESVPAQYWRGQAIEVLVQATPARLESFPDRLFVDEESALKVLVEDHKLRSRMLNKGKKRTTPIHHKSR